MSEGQQSETPNLITPETIEKHWQTLKQDNSKQPQEESPQEGIKPPSGVTFTDITHLLFQHAGVIPMDKQGNPLIIMPKDIRPIRNTDKFKFKSFRSAVNFSVTPEVAQKAGYPVLEASLSDFLTKEGLREVLIKVKLLVEEYIDSYLQQKDPNSADLSSLIKKEPDFYDQFFEAFAKLRVIRELTKELTINQGQTDTASPNQPYLHLQENLDALLSFFQEDVMPSFGIEFSDDGLPKSQAYRDFLLQKEKKLKERKTTRRIKTTVDGEEKEISETYEEKARRVLFTGSKKKPYDEEKRQRAQRLFTAIATGTIDSSLEPTWQERQRPIESLEDLLLETATTINHLRLLRMINKHLLSLPEKQKTDLLQIKQELEVKLEELKKLNPPETPITSTSQMETEGFDPLSDEQKQKIAEILKTIAPITNYIANTFLHEDGVYLLGQALDRYKASCASKSLMLSLVLKDLGLEAVDSPVDVRVNSNWQGEHGLTHLLLPGNIIVGLDLNYSRRCNFFFDTNKFKHLDRQIFNHFFYIGVIAEESAAITDPEQLTERINERKTTVIINGDHLPVFVYGQAHRFSSFPDPTKKEALFDYLNYGAFYWYFFQLEENHEKKRYYAQLALKYYNKAIERNPNYAEAYHNRAVLCSDPQFLELFAITTEDRKKYLTQALDDYNKAIELNPNYAKAYYNRGATILDYYTFLYQDNQSQIKALQEAKDDFNRFCELVNNENDPLVKEARKYIIGIDLVLLILNLKVSILTLLKNKKD